MTVVMHIHISASGWKNRLVRNTIGPLILCLVLGMSASAGEADTITVPISIDYPLLRILTRQAAFTGPNHAARVLDIEDGCTTVTIYDPQFAEHDGLVRFESRVTLKAGKSFGNHCFMPVAWQGYVVLFQQPEIDPADWQLSFKTIDSTVYDRHHRPEKMLGALWKLMRAWVYPYLNQIHINLAPPVDDLKYTLFPMFPPKKPDHAQKILDSVRPGELFVRPEHIQINMKIDTPSNEKDISQDTFVPLSKDELDQFIATWETWDALLVDIISSFAGKSLSEDQRQILLDTLLDTRHRFSAALANDKIGKGFIKRQFLRVWELIAPVFRAHLSEASSERALGYLAFFTASDALAALDKLGPSMGIEMSREGFIRLARLLGESSDSLRYQPEENKRLRRIFKFPSLGEEDIPTGTPPPEPVLPTRPDSQRERDMNKIIDARWHIPVFNLVVARQAWAAEKQAGVNGTKPHIKSWIVPEKNVKTYLARIKNLLKTTAGAAIEKNSIPSNYDALFKDLISATAWQETCFRQFHTQNNRLVYIRSYNGSSVGLMQINERVWRGIYDLNRLRWNIHYNASAGCEIAAMYFRRYVLKRINKIKPLNKTTMAGIVYAMYNGGPGQFNKFLGRLKTGRFQLSDRLFREKFTWVINNQWEYINQCLVVS